MTESWEEESGTGPGVAMVPWDRDPDNGPEAPEGDRTGEGAVEEKLVRIEALLKGWNEGFEQRLNKVQENFLRLLRTVPTTADFEGLKTDQEVGLVGVREDLANIRHHLRELGPAATRQDVESVLNRLHTDFGWVREHLTFLRGVASVWSPPTRQDPAPRSRAGVAMLCLLWALTVLVAFGAGAVAFGGLRVDVVWEQGSARDAAFGPMSLHGDWVDERRRGRVAAEGAARAMEWLRELAVERLPAEGGPLGDDVHPSVAPPAPHRDLAIPGEEVRPAYGPVRRGPPVAERGTP
ncbi:MAG: hypothetical protein OXH50_05645 [Gemmatimonadetes bacterium]|nr:hypothetical protein [Gemmatimonadota bacterium]